MNNDTFNSSSGRLPRSSNISGDTHIRSAFCRLWSSSGFSSPVHSSFAGLFWFNEDYSDVIDLKGLVEFDSLNVTKRDTILPDGVHAQYRNKRYSTPRGRVELNNGVPTISVGESAPDSAVYEIKRAMGLLHFSHVEVRRSSFWDGK